MIIAFDYSPMPAHILFGAGRLAEVGDAVRALGCCRALVLSTEEQKDAAEEVATALGKICLGVYARAVMHTPVDVTEKAMKVIREQRVDCLISFGGGSTIGLGKAIAYRTDLPQIAIPTTYAGSEVTPILGQTEDGVKTTLKSPKVLPETVIYDPSVTLSLPRGMSVTSGINAIAHAVEALYAKDRNPISSLMAAEGAKALIEALPRIVADGTDAQARERAFYGSWLCGAVLGQVGMSLHHKLCHVLGGTFDLPHAPTHTVVLPHATAYNAVEVPDLLRPIAEALDSDHPGQGLYHFARTLNAPMSLQDLGMPEEGIARAADIAMSKPYWNPRPLERDAIETTIRAAWEGAEPKL